MAIAGLWELGWNTPIKEAELWEYVLRDFSVEAFYMCPVSGIHAAFIQERPELPDVLDEYRTRGIPIVFVEARAATPLRQFDHPREALYIFGKATLNPLVAYGRAGDLSVWIETPQQLGALWPHQAAAIVLYDRQVKAWR